MFTGIVEEIGNVRNIIRGTDSIKISINCNKILDDVKKGDSISVNGVCITAVALGNGWFTADVMPETMRRSNLGQLNISDKINLERALKLSDRLGGHIVSGHIDGIGTIIGKKDEDNAVWLTIGAHDEILKYIVIKGSIAVDGTSLTVAYTDDSCFKVSLIPLTMEDTVLSAKKAGDMVNIECDIIGKYIEKFVGGRTSQNSIKKDLTLDFLKENGFV